MSGKSVDPVSTGNSSNSVALPPDSRRICQKENIPKKSNYFDLLSHRQIRIKVKYTIISVPVNFYCCCCFPWRFDTWQDPKLGLALLACFPNSPQHLPGTHLLFFSAHTHTARLWWRALFLPAPPLSENLLPSGKPKISFISTSSEVYREEVLWQSSRSRMQSAVAEWHNVTRFRLREKKTKKKKKKNLSSFSYSHLDDSQQQQQPQEKIVKSEGRKLNFEKWK